MTSSHLYSSGIYETVEPGYCQTRLQAGDKAKHIASAYSNVTNNFFNYAAQWINDRF